MRGSEVTEIEDLFVLCHFLEKIEGIFGVALIVDVGVLKRT